MKVIRSLDDVKIDGQTVVALRNFDGVHFGHREILLREVRKAKRNNWTPVCFTLSTHTRK